MEVITIGWGTPPPMTNGMVTKGKYSCLGGRSEASINKAVTSESTRVIKYGVICIFVTIICSFVFSLFFFFFFFPIWRLAIGNWQCVCSEQQNIPDEFCSLRLTLGDDDGGVLLVLSSHDLELGLLCLLLLDLLRLNGLCEFRAECQVCDGHIVQHQVEVTRAGLQLVTDVAGHLKTQRDDAMR